MPTILPSSDLLPVFNALPGTNLLLGPDLRIVAASDDYLAATLTERATRINRHGRQEVVYGDLVFCFG